MKTGPGILALRAAVGMLFVGLRAGRPGALHRIAVRLAADLAELALIAGPDRLPFVFMIMHLVGSKGARGGGGEIAADLADFVGTLLS